MLSRARTGSGERLPYSGINTIALTEVYGVRCRPPPSELGGGLEILILVLIHLGRRHPEGMGVRLCARRGGGLQPPASTSS